MAGKTTRCGGAQNVGGGANCVFADNANFRTPTLGLSGSAVLKGLTESVVAKGLGGSAVTEGFTGSIVTEGLVGCSSRTPFAKITFILFVLVIATRFKTEKGIC
jgi:hypothetical protein